jgi:2-dehydro-3-deoxy-D-arabinonate dehydratase
MEDTGMLLTRHLTDNGVRWASNGIFLTPFFSLSAFLGVSRENGIRMVEAHLTDSPTEGCLLAPIDDSQEVWASGVTYLRSREARKEESESADVYQKVYDADRPELFFKACGWRVVGHCGAIRVRRDSAWNVPEPEMTIVVNSRREIIGYCAGNDVSSRSIEGENPLYLPQAKIFNGCCALGPAIKLTYPDEIRDMGIHMEIMRGESSVFEGNTRTSKINRSFESLIEYLFLETDFPTGVFLMTGTGIVPPEGFSLSVGDKVAITIGDLNIGNVVANDH